MNIFQAAELAWPEDEASITADRYDGDQMDEWAKQCLAKDVAHMHKVFRFEDDADELIQRYDAHLAKLLGISPALL